MNYLKESILKSIKKDDGNLWPEEDVNTLIEFYQENGYLWNHHLETHKDRNLKEATFSRISEILPQYSKDEIKKQWHSLKTISDREDKQAEGSKKSGCGTDNVYIPSWKFYSQMCFTKESRDMDEAASTMDLLGDTSPPSPKRFKKEQKSMKQNLIDDMKMKLFKDVINVMKGAD